MSTATATTTPLLTSDDNGVSIGAHCKPVDVIVLDMIVRVNREFERLVGHSQRAVKSIMVKDSMKGILRLYDVKPVPQIISNLLHGRLGAETEAVSHVNINTRWRLRIDCIQTCRFEKDEFGLLRSTVVGFTPLQS
jgi:hypothetical protein